MEGIILVFVALLAGVVLWLVLAQRHYQRLDYGHLLAQEERERQIVARLRQAEELLLTLRDYERARKLELEQFIAAAQQEMAAEILAARQAIVAEVLNNPAAYDQLLLADTGSLPAHGPVATLPALVPAQAAAAGGNLNLLRFVRSPYQQRIAELLEHGFTPQEVTRELGVSHTEVQLVSSIIFGERTA